VREHGRLVLEMGPFLSSKVVAMATLLAVSELFWKLYIYAEMSLSLPWSVYPRVPNATFYFGIAAWETK
jgi:hypothetical protein